MGWVVLASLLFTIFFALLCFEKGNFSSSEEQLSPLKPIIFEPADATYKPENFYPVLHEKMSKLVDAVKEVSAPYFVDDLSETTVFKIEPYDDNFGQAVLKDQMTRMLQISLFLSHYTAMAIESKQLETYASV